MKELRNALAQLVAMEARAPDLVDADRAISDATRVVVKATATAVEQLAQRVEEAITNPRITFQQGPIDPQSLEIIVTPGPEAIEPQPMKVVVTPGPGAAAEVPQA